MSSTTKSIGTIISAGRQVKLPVTILKSKFLPLFPCSSRLNSDCLCFQKKRGGGGGEDKNEVAIYETRKYGHRLPENNASIKFEPLQDMPNGIFRNTLRENQGWGSVGKDNLYKNPEYYCYQHMSYYDIHYHLQEYRQAMKR